MARSVLKEAYFHDEAAAFAALEGILWPGGKPPHCPHCGATDRLNRLANQTSKPSKKHPDGKTVFGLWKCYHCRQQFTVRKGTIFEESRLELHLWFQAAYLMCSSKKGVSANQLHRTLGCTLKTAWFLAHRLREAMRSGDISPMGSGGAYVEIDETYIGKNKRPFNPRYSKAGPEQKNVVLTLVSRKGGARSFHVDRATADNILPIIRANIALEARVMTDESRVYGKLNREYAHATVNHSVRQYADGDVSTNTVEGYFSIFKRGMKGVYQHCSEKHLHRYLAEFDFRYSHRVALGVDDVTRATIALKGAKGKRLTYAWPDSPLVN